VCVFPYIFDNTSHLELKSKARRNDNSVTIKCTAVSKFITNLTSEFAQF